MAVNTDDGSLSEMDTAFRPAAVTGERQATRGGGHSLVVWLTLLAVVFVTEYAVMLILFRLFPARSSPMLLSAVDAIILTLILAPVLWWTLVRPIAETNRLRSQFLSDLFAQIEIDRRQTAYELHDGVGQSLTLLISGLRSAKSCRAVEECAGRVNGFQRLAEDALADVRRLALGLRPNLLDDLGLAAAVERLVEDVRAHCPIHISLDVSGVIGLQFSEQVATAVFRIVQEALANVMKHSNAKQATVAIRQANGGVVVEVCDDGCGIAPERLRTLPAGHLGFRGMRERAALLGGKFTLGHTLGGGGTRVSVTIPTRGSQRG